MLYSVKDRINLFLWIIALPSGQFEALLFALKPPNGIVPGNSAPQGDRLARLLEWVESPSGCGMEALFEALEAMEMPPKPPDMSLLYESPLANEGENKSLANTLEGEYANYGADYLNHTDHLIVVRDDNTDGDDFDFDMFSDVMENFRSVQEMLIEVRANPSWEKIAQTTSKVFEKYPIEKPEDIAGFYLWVDL